MNNVNKMITPSKFTPIENNNNQQNVATFKKSSLAVLITLAFIVSGCSSTMMTPDKDVTVSKVKVNGSFLENDKAVVISEQETLAENDKSNGEFVRLNSLENNKPNLKLEIDLSKQFENKKTFQLSVNELPLNDFLHYVLGDLLKVSYLIEPSVKSNVSPVTLELKEKVSAQRLFQLVQQILNQNNVAIAFNDDLFYVHTVGKKANKSSKAFGFGRDVSNVPNVSGEIIQLVPLKFGTTRGLKTTIGALVDAKISLDSSQGLMTITGKREQILRTLSLVHLLDSTELNKKAIALLSFNYIDSQTFVDKVTELLEQEGIKASRTLNESSSVNFISIEHLGQVVVFASADEILTRVEYWTKQLDKPASGSEQSFYTYHPRYARASDLGNSLAPLLGGNNGGNFNQNRRQTNNNATNNEVSPKNAQGVNASSTQTIEGDNIRLVVDERSNALIFYSTGKFYQELLPIIKKLDVMPKQVMLEVVIAEVKLTGSFAKGVEFAIKSGASGNNQKSFSYNGQDGFGYSMVGLSGTLNVNLNQKDGLINVLSRPTLLVRDGVSASISVGDDIPTVGSTTSDPINGERETTTIQYRKTGIDLTVTPTVNAQGTVIMTIEQNISNISPDGIDVSGSPSIFERKISTEVVAGDGQTVLLGGLISENKSSNANSIPILGSLPIIGHLFRSDADSSDKTELVILVTPKIINNASDWGRIQQSFIDGLENIEF
jgi:general secretion pathway protein D